MYAYVLAAFFFKGGKGPKDPISGLKSLIGLAVFLSFPGTVLWILRFSCVELFGPAKHSLGRQGGGWGGGGSVHSVNATEKWSLSEREYSILYQQFSNTKCEACSKQWLDQI